MDVGLLRTSRVLRCCGRLGEVGGRDTTANHSIEASRVCTSLSPHSRCHVALGGHFLPMAVQFSPAPYPAKEDRASSRRRGNKREEKAGGYEPRNRPWMSRRGRPVLCTTGTLVDAQRVILQNGHMDRSSSLGLFLGLIQPRSSAPSPEGEGR